MADFGIINFSYRLERGKKQEVDIPACRPGLDSRFVPPPYRSLLAAPGPDGSRPPKPVNVASGKRNAPFPDNSPAPEHLHKDIAGSRSKHGRCALQSGKVPRAQG
jgi:hypothetical protein